MATQAVAGEDLDSGSGDASMYSFNNTISENNSADYGATFTIVAAATFVIVLACFVSCVPEKIDANKHVALTNNDEANNLEMTRLSSQHVAEGSRQGDGLGYALA